MTKKEEVMYKEFERVFTAMSTKSFNVGNRIAAAIDDESMVVTRVKSLTRKVVKIGRILAVMQLHKVENQLYTCLVRNGWWCR